MKTTEMTKMNVDVTGGSDIAIDSAKADTMSGESGSNSKHFPTIEMHTDMQCACSGSGLSSSSPKGSNHTALHSNASEFKYKREKEKVYGSATP